MSKTAKIIAAVVAAIILLVAGAKYSEQIKGHVSWMSEGKTDEAVLPDLSNEEIENAAKKEEMSKEAAPSEEAKPAESEATSTKEVK